MYCDFFYAKTPWSKIFLINITFLGDLLYTWLLRQSTKCETKEHYDRSCELLFEFLDQEVCMTDFFSIKIFSVSPFSPFYNILKSQYLFISKSPYTHATLYTNDTVQISTSFNVLISLYSTISKSLYSNTPLSTNYTIKISTLLNKSK